LTTPRRLDIVGELSPGRKVGIDLFGEVGVIGQCRIDQRFCDGQELCGSGSTLVCRNIAIDDGTDDVGYLGSTDEHGSATGWSVSEYHQWVSVHAQSLIDQSFGQGRDPDVAPVGAVLESLV
jgi:hypothetical protein